MFEHAVYLLNLIFLQVKVTVFQCGIRLMINKYSYVSFGLHLTFGLDNFIDYNIFAMILLQGSFLLTIIAFKPKMTEDYRSYMWDSNLCQYNRINVKLTHLV